MKQFMPELTPKERTMLMQENASKVEKKSYQKQLTPDELSLRREDLSDNCIKLNAIEDELKEIKDDYKGRMDPLKTVHKNLLIQIKTKQATVDGILYHMANHDEGMMETYDSEGILVETRRLRPEEKQGALFPLSKASGE